MRLTADPCGLFGFSTAGVGDFNGDGHQDFAVSEPFGGPIISIYWGGPGVDSIADFRLRTLDPSHDADFGSLIASAGDFNGDGFDDVAASVNGGGNRFYVFYGGAVPDSIPDLSLSFPAGTSPAGIVAGDVNNDGYSDLVVAYEQLSSAHGRVFVYLGGLGADALPDLELEANPNDFVGSGIGPARGSGLALADMNGDGVPDIIVQSASGLRVYYGGLAMDNIEDLRLTGPRIAGGIIRAIASAGDINGDGAEDMMVATSEGEDSWVRGRIQIYYGGSGIDSIPDVTLHAKDAGGMIGPAMVTLGDTNGDGYADILVGTNYDSAGGRVDLFLGGTAMDTTAATSIVSSVEANFGAILGSADANGDGVLDAFVSLLVNCTASSLGKVLVYDFSAPLPSRAFVQGDRTVHLGNNDSPVCIRLEPVGNTYKLTEVDVSSIRLTTKLGSILPIPQSAARRLVIGDSDRNGVSELPLWFRSRDQEILFGSIEGRTTVQATLDGRLMSRRALVAPVAMTIIGKPHRPHPRSSLLAPNPMNPVGTLFFATRRPGHVSVRIFDAAGRLVCTALSEQLEAGSHSVLFDGRDGEGAEIGSGVYFYRIDTTEGQLSGRFVIAR